MKKVIVACAVLVALISFSVSTSYAQSWWEGQPFVVDSIRHEEDGSVRVALTFNSGANTFFAIIPAGSVNKNALLATLLTAASTGITVQPKIGGTTLFGVQLNN